MSRFAVTSIFREAIPDPDWTDFSGNRTLAALDDGLGWDVSGGNGTLTLTSVALSPGRILHITRTSATSNTATITPFAGDTIGGAASLQLYNQWESVTLGGDGPGTNWIILSHVNAPSTPSASTQLGIAKAAATVALTLSGTQTVDTIGLLVGDVCLVTAQGTASQNGPWVVAAGAWTRPSWYAHLAVITPGGYIEVYAGSGNGPAIWFLNSSVSITVDTTGTSWVTPNAAPPTGTSAVYLGQVTVVSTANQTLSGFPTIDGVTLAAGSIILLTGQTSAIENGPWNVAVGAWSRPYWYATGQTVAYGRLVWVGQGTVTT